jgi:hypothetical protein
VYAGVLEKLPLLKLVWGLLSSGVDGGGGVGSRGCSTRAAARPMLLPDVRPEKASGPATSAQLLTHSILLHAHSTPRGWQLAPAPQFQFRIIELLNFRLVLSEMLASLPPQPPRRRQTIGCK